MRFALIFSTSAGNDIPLAEDKIKGMKHFANKLWNIARFVMESTAKFDTAQTYSLDAEDQTTMDEIGTLLSEITAEMNEYKFYLVAEKLYHYIWHTFADIVIERSKKKIAEGGAGAESAQTMLLAALPLFLRALHPFMPYITEELWALIGKNDGQAENSLIVQKWPVLG